MSPTAQPQMNLIQTADYRESYANSVQVRVSVWDFSLVFGLASSDRPDQVTIRNHQAIFLSPQQAKALWNVLGQNLAQYEQAFGTLEPRATERQLSAGSSQLAALVRSRAGSAVWTSRKMRPVWRHAAAAREAGYEHALRLRQIIEPRLDAPFPLWMIFPVIFAALYASHFSLLRLPYYWDEAGYYIPAAWDFFRTGSLIPTTTLSNAHPPLPSLYLALWWKLSGYYPEVTREAVLIVASLGLLAVWRLAHARRTARGRWLSGPWSSPAFTQSGLRRARWPRRIFLRRRFACGDWSTRCRTAIAGRGSRRCGSPLLCCRRRLRLDSADTRGDRRRGCIPSATQPDRGRLWSESGMAGELRVAAGCVVRVALSRRPGSSSAIPSSSGTTQRRISRRCGFWRRSVIVCCT